MLKQMEKTFIILRWIFFLSKLDKKRIQRYIVNYGPMILYWEKTQIRLRIYNINMGKCTWNNVKIEMPSYIVEDSIISFFCLFIEVGFIDYK